MSDYVFPTRMKKSDFFKLYYPENEGIIRQRLSHIIFEMRKNFPENKDKSKRKITSGHTLRHEEMTEYAAIYGFPIIQEKK